eukprot:4625295-Alexandrium_andersonii.AAC.1
MSTSTIPAWVRPRCRAGCGVPGCLWITKPCRSRPGRGAHFLHEHPASASSRQEPAMVELLAQPGAGSVVGHMV